MSNKKAKRSRNGQAKRQRNYSRTIRALTPESLESRLLLDGSGFVGNACAPDLDMSEIGVQSTRVNEEVVLDLRSAGATVTDLDANGDPTGDTIRFQLDPDDGPANATLTSDGVFRWTPNGDQIGRFEFVVIVVDEGDPPLADAEVLVVEVLGNEAPNLADIGDSSVAVNDELVVNLSATDPDGDNLTFLLDPDQLTSDGVSLEQIDNNSAVLRWTPTAADTGQNLTFSVLVVDDGFPPLSDNEMFVVSVLTVGAVDDAYGIPSGEVLAVDAASGVLANDVDSNGDALTAVLVSEPTSGSISLAADGSFTYTPNSSFEGADSFTYQAQDGNGDTSTAMVTINVSPANSVPVAEDDAFDVNEDAALSVDAASGLLTNDSDADGETLTITLVQDVSSGTLMLNPDGSFDYTPLDNFNGTATFTYVAGDGAAQSSEATVTITVNSVNDAPTAAPDTFEAVEDTQLVIAGDAGVLVNDSDEDSATLTVEIVDAPASGSLNLNADGGFTYTPNENFNGTDTFSYTASDGESSSDAVLASILVAAVNDPPVANPDTYAAGSGIEVSIDAASGVLNNDVDVDGDALTVELVSSTSNGTLTLNPDGSFAYTSDAGFSGPDTFTYRITDGELNSTQTTAAILVTQVNQAPTAAGDTYQATEDEVLVVDAIRGVLANDSDPDGDPLTAIITNQPVQGTLAFNPDGSFEYIANQNSTELDGFSYQASDGTSTSEEVLVVLLVATSNDAPVAQDDSYEVMQGEQLSVPVGSGVLANDTDVEGDTLTAAIVSQAGNGTVDLQSDGSFSYTPSDGFAGTDTFTYQASDGVDTSDVATVNIEVHANNVFAISSGAAVGSVVGSVVPEGQFDPPVIYQFANENVDAELLLNADDHLSGDPAAAVVLIEYLDFQCPACAAYHPIVNQLEADFAGDLLVVRRHLPLESIHLNARAGARAAEAAGRQGMFEEMGDLLFENQDDWEFVNDPTPFFESYATTLGLDLDQFRLDVADPAVDARITRDLNVAAGLGATGTPTFFVDNVRITNPSTDTEFANVIQGAVDAIDDPFAVNRETGEIVVADNSSLTSQTLAVLVTDGEENTETIEVMINVMDTTSGGVASISAVDDAFANEEDWLTV